MTVRMKSPVAGGAAGLDKTSFPGGIDCLSNAPEIATAQAQIERAPHLQLAPPAPAGPPRRLAVCVSARRWRATLGHTRALIIAERDLDELIAVAMRMEQRHEHGRGMSQKNLDLIEHCRSILAEIQPTTVRGVAYQLFTRGLIENMGRKCVANVSRMIVIARVQPVLAEFAVSCKILHGFGSATSLHDVAQEHDHRFQNRCPPASTLQKARRRAWTLRPPHRSNRSPDGRMSRRPCKRKREAASKTEVSSDDLPARSHPVLYPAPEKTRPESVNVSVN